MPLMWMRARVHFYIDYNDFLQADWPTRKQRWHFPNCVCKQLKWGYCGCIFYLTYFCWIGHERVYLHETEWAGAKERKNKGNITFNICGIQFGWIANSYSQKNNSDSLLRHRVFVTAVRLSGSESRKRPSLMQLLWNYFFAFFTFFSAFVLFCFFPRLHHFI